MRPITCGVVAVLVILTVSCGKQPVASYEVRNIQEAPQSFVPTTGGLVEWSSHKIDFGIVPVFDWPCQPKSSHGSGGETIVTCDFPKIPSDASQFWAYHVTNGLAKGAGFVEGPVEILQVDHCTDCDGSVVATFVAPSSPNPIIGCSNGKASADPNPVPATPNQKITWIVEGTAPKPDTQILKFDDPNACDAAASKLTGRSPYCTGKNGGSYTIQNVPDCPNPSTGWSVQVGTNPQRR